MIRCLTLYETTYQRQAWRLFVAPSVRRVAAALFTGSRMRLSMHAPGHHVLTYCSSNEGKAVACEAIEGVYSPNHLQSQEEGPCSAYRQPECCVAGVWQWSLPQCSPSSRWARALPEVANRDYTPKVSIGINSGEMISGNIGSATLRRLDYTVIGDVVNTAQRLQSTATPGQIIVNELAYEKIKQSFNFNKVGEVKLKNKANPVTIYTVLD